MSVKSREKLLYFTLGGGVIEIGEKQVELPPIDYRVYFNQYDDGKVICTQLDRKTGDTWIRDKLWNELDESLTDAIEADFKAEQKEIVESYDRWRYGS